MDNVSVSVGLVSQIGLTSVFVQEFLAAGDNILILLIVIIPPSSQSSLCSRDDADMLMLPYIRKACNRPNAAFVSLFRYLTVILECFST